jgi:hypothetical protein
MPNPDTKGKLGFHLQAPATAQLPKAQREAQSTLG